MGNSASPEKMRATLATKPTVIVVGGGYGGMAAAKKLDLDLNVILIDKKNHFFHNVGALRPCVEPKTIYKALIPYDRLLTMGAFIQGTVTKITENSVILQGYENTPLKFDYCIIATGSEYAFPMKNHLSQASDVQSKFDKVYSVIEKSNDITIVGGGPVGIELLGEIGFKFSNKNITLIQSNSKILPGGISDTLRNSILQRIKDNFSKCKVITGERVNITDEMKNELDDAKEGNRAYLEGKREIETNKGNKYNTDLIFFATGTRIRNSAWNECFKDAINSENGRLKVKNTLQVEGFDKIFAIGDCADAGPKMGYLADEEAGVAAANIKAISQGKGGKMKTWGNPPNGMFVPLGPNQGAAQLPVVNKVVGATLTSKLKGATLFYGKYWEELGYKKMEEKLISLTPQEINKQLNDEDFQRLSKGVGLDEKVFKNLVIGGTSDTNANAKENVAESKENDTKENDTKEKENENKANENKTNDNNDDNDDNDNNDNNDKGSSGDAPKDAPAAEPPAEAPAESPVDAPADAQAEANGDEQGQQNGVAQSGDDQADAPAEAPADAPAGGADA